MAKFRLATLLKIRQRDRDLAAKAVQEVHMAIAKLDDAQKEIDQANYEMDRLRKDASQGSLHLQRILDAQRYQLVLSAQSAQIAEHKEKLNQELQRRQFILVQKQQALKSLEKLRDQRAQAEETYELAKQQERLDEWASTRHARQILSDHESH